MDRTVYDIAMKEISNRFHIHKLWSDAFLIHNGPKQEGTKFPLHFSCVRKIWN
jgi:hypothetical protein